MFLEILEKISDVQPDMPEVMRLLTDVTGPPVKLSLQQSLRE